MRLAFVLVASLALLVGGCGSNAVDDIPFHPDAGDGSTGDASRDATSAGDATNDALPPADGPFACGSQTCGATQLCVHPCCGGTAPPCEPALDGGACPAGFHPDPSCPQQSGGCRADPCTPPPPYCTDKVTEPGCTLTQGHDVMCLCA